MKALFIAQGPLTWASSRYRAWWLAEQADWIDCVQAGDAVSVFDYDAYIFQKVLDFRSAALLKKKRKHVWLDLADPLWWLRPDDFAAMCDVVDGIVFSNEGLREHFHLSGFDNAKRTKVIPDRMLPSFHPTWKEHKDTDVPVVLWYGWSPNRVTLSGAALAFHYARAKGVDFKLRILDDGSYGGDVEGVPTEYRQWRLDTFHQELLDADVVISPPFPGVWGEMKSENKAVSAWWAGLPVSECKNPANFVELLTDWELRRVRGSVVRVIAQSYWATQHSVEDWKELLVG